MNKKSLWFGYLDAGQQSSAVIKDPALNTGKNATLYLYNHSRKSILEYQRNIVENKLRELEDGEVDANELFKAYKKIRLDFLPGGGRIQREAEQPPVPKAKPDPMPGEEPELGEDFIDDPDVED